MGGGWEVGGGDEISLSHLLTMMVGLMSSLMATGIS